MAIVAVVVVKAVHSGSSSGAAGSNGVSNVRSGNHGQSNSGGPIGAAAGARQPLGIRGKWRMILNSPFTGTTLNTAVWRTGWFGTGITGPVNSNEIACYSSGNITMPGDGAVSLSVTRTPSRCSGNRRNYTGAILSSNPLDGRHRGGGFQYRYGVLQARVYVPGGLRVANWPAVITLGQNWPTDGEDDVMENLEGTVCAHFHSPGYAPGGNLGNCDPTVTPGWHIVSSNWEPGSISWYYDGVEVAHAARGVTSEPMYIVLLNSVSTKAPGLARNASMRVSYVRVWQKAS